MPEWRAIVNGQSSAHYKLSPGVGDSRKNGNNLQNLQHNWSEGSTEDTKQVNLSHLFISLGQAL